MSSNVNTICVLFIDEAHSTGISVDDCLREHNEVEA